MSEHPMHPLVDSDGKVTEIGRDFIRRSGEIMDEAVAAATPVERNRCWRSECRNDCYYPTACTRGQS